MKKNPKLYVYAFMSIAALLPLLSFADRGGFGGGRSGFEESRGGYDQQPFQNHEDYNTGAYGGVYGGVLGEEYINPYPDPESEPGMGDDTNQLYNYYERDNRY